MPDLDERGEFPEIIKIRASQKNCLTAQKHARLIFGPGLGLGIGLGLKGGSATGKSIWLSER